MRQRFETAQWVPYPVDQVFAFFANPHNLPLLMPEEHGMRIEKLDLVAPPPNPAEAGSQPGGTELVAGAGTEMKISFRPVPLLPVRTSWVARITEFAWLIHFCDEQIKGPFEFFRHCHRMRPEIQHGQIGTELSDQVEFSLPLGAVGQLGSKVVLRQMTRMFRMRQERLPRILAAKVTRTS